MNMPLIILIAMTISISAEGNSQSFLNGHLPKGCPENSYCNKELAELNTRWTEALNNPTKKKYHDLNLNKKKFGSPINFYHATSAPKMAKHILWDSRCKNHKKAPTKIYEARNFFKKLPTSDPNENSFFSYILIEKANQTQRITISRGDFPLFYQDNAVYLNREEDANYYGVIIKASGEFKITAPIQTKLVPQEVKCPDNLMNKLRPLIKNKSVYTSAICRKIWDRKKQVFYTYITGDACF